MAEDDLKTAFTLKFYIVMLKKQRKYCRYRTNTELMQSFLKKGSYWR